MDELQRPRVYGDRLMVILSKVDKEIQVNDEVFVDRDDIFHEPQDLANIARMQNRIREVHSDLFSDRMRGDTAMDIIKYEIVESMQFNDLILRMVEADIFPEIKNLYKFCELN